MGSIDPRTIMDKVAREKERNSSVLIGQRRCSGFIDCELGESYLFVPFPTTFVEKPLVTFGAELSPGLVPVPGRWPVINTLVKDFVTAAPGETSNTLWTGMLLLIVFTGGNNIDRITGKVHWQAVGKSFTNPTRGQ